MANHAMHHTQLPIMVRKPKAVWPGLVKMGMYQKEIAGDGNCLFASLSDQLHGTPAKHPEIRASIIEHMRTYRPLFEHYVHKDDVQQRRALRERTLAARKPYTEDAFEEYLLLMSRTGTYGGEPELVAFCQVYDQDVTVHLPTLHNAERDSILYKNEQREADKAIQPLHICYGGDEVTRAHYDSARSKNSVPSAPRTALVAERRRSSNGQVSRASPSTSERRDMRSVNHGREDLSPQQIHDFLREGRIDRAGSFEHLDIKDRTRSSSLSSSHRSSSSKRSFEDDGEQARKTKRTYRRKGMKQPVEALKDSFEQGMEGHFRLRVESPAPGTPGSTQETQYSSDLVENVEAISDGDEDYQQVKTPEDSDDSEKSSSQYVAIHQKPHVPRRRLAYAATRKTVASTRGPPTPTSLGAS